jgi:hypothetical protein
MTSYRFKTVQCQRVGELRSVLISGEEHFHASDTLWPVSSPDLTVLDFFLPDALQECAKQIAHTHYTS